jgi:hypothetical protein
LKRIEADERTMDVAVRNLIPSAAWLADGRARYATVGFVVDLNGVPQQLDVDCDDYSGMASQLRAIARTWRSVIRRIERIDPDRRRASRSYPSNFY